MARTTRFGFKRLDVYRLAVEHFAWVGTVARRLPRGPFVVVNQALGSALSIPGNIAEGFGRERKPREMSQHLRYALGSAFEAAAYLDALVAMGVISDDEYNLAEERLSRVSAMLTRLMQKQTLRRKAARAARGETAPRSSFESPRSGVLRAAQRRRGIESPPGGAAAAEGSPRFESPQSGVAEAASAAEGDRPATTPR